MEQVRVLSLRFVPYTFEGALLRAESLLAGGQGGRIYTPNAEIALRAARSPAFSDMLARADLLLPDGVGVTAAARWAGNSLPRIAGIDFAEALLARRKQPCRLFLFGGAAGVAVRAAKTLSARYPNVEIVGTRNGFFRADEERAIYEEILRAKPDLLFVCLGSPKQEEWIERHRVPALAIGLGGALDVWAGDKHRAPSLVRQAGLEWFFRLAQDPKRIRRAAALPAFVLWVLYDRQKERAKCRGRG